MSSISFPRYDPVNDVLVVVDGNRDPTLAANAARLGSYVRASAEGTHGPLKNSYKHLGAKVHNSRMNAVGQTTLDYYNHRHGMNYGQEWAESPKLLVEYLVTAGRFNQEHPKFAR